MGRPARAEIKSNFISMKNRWLCACCAYNQVFANNGVNLRKTLFRKVLLNSCSLSSQIPGKACKESNQPLKSRLTITGQETCFRSILEIMRGNIGLHNKMRVHVDYLSSDFSVCREFNEKNLRHCEEQSLVLTPVIKR